MIGYLKIPGPFREHEMLTALAEESAVVSELEELGYILVGKGRDTRIRRGPTLGAALALCDVLRVV